MVKRYWKHGRTMSISVPQVFYEKLLLVALKWDEEGIPDDPTSTIDDEIKDKAIALIFQTLEELTKPSELTQPPELKKDSHK